MDTKQLQETHGSTCTSPEHLQTLWLVHAPATHIYNKHVTMRDFRLPLRCKYDLRSSEMLRSAEW